MKKKRITVSKRSQTKNKTPAKTKVYAKKKAAKKPKIKPLIREIIILKPKKEKPAPSTYEAMAKWLENTGKQDLGFKITGRKKKFTPQQKTKITRLFKGTKKQYQKKDGTTGTAYVGGLYQWRDAHAIKIKSEKQKSILKNQGAKIIGDTVYLPRRQKGERITIKSDGTRIRKVGGTTFKTYPLTKEQITELHDDPEGSIEWLEEYIGPIGQRRTARIEYTNGFGNTEEDIELLVKSSGFVNTSANQRIIGIVITEHGEKPHDKRKKKAGRKKKKSRNH